MANVVAPVKWKIGTLETIKSASKLNSNIQSKIKQGHVNDPLPSFHDQGLSFILCVSFLLVLYSIKFEGNFFSWYN